MEDKITMDETMATDFSKLVVVNASEDPQDMTMKILLSDTLNWIYITMGTALYDEILTNLLMQYAKRTDPEHILILHGTKVAKDWNNPINRYNYVNFEADSFEIKMLSINNLPEQFKPESGIHDENGTEYYTRD